MMDACSWASLLLNMGRTSKDGGLFLGLGIVGQGYGVVLFLLRMCLLYGVKHCTKGWVMWLGRGELSGSSKLIGWEWALCVICFLRFLYWLLILTLLLVIVLRREMDVLYGVCLLGEVFGDWRGSNMGSP